MRYFSLSRGCAGLLLVSVTLSGGCGYLPSEMDGKPKPDKDKKAPDASATWQHTASCGTSARRYKLVRFEDLYDATDDPRHPFSPAANLPQQYDVRAYVWGFDNCMALGNCTDGDHYWLIRRGPEDDFGTWAVTPQFPRITITSRCKGDLKIGKRYRFSFNNGALVGFSPD